MFPGAGALPVRSGRKTEPVRANPGDRDLTSILRAHPSEERHDPQKNTRTGSTVREEERAVA
jgi:hypothetical protein